MERSAKNYNSFIVENYKIPPILFNRVLGKITRSATAGLFLSQLLFWWDKGGTDGWIYKTIKDVESETCLKRSEQDRAIRAWKTLGVLKVKLRGIPRKRYFQIDIHVLGTLIVDYLRRSSVQKPAHKPAKSTAAASRNEHAITENTKEKNQKSDFNDFQKKRSQLNRRWSFPNNQ